MKIYFDMDGVLADFQNHFKSFYPQITDLWGLEDDVFWPLVKAIPNFWEDLPVMADALELFKYAQDNHEVQILSSPSSHDDRSFGGKIKWVRKHLGDDIRVNLVKRSSKQLFSEEGTVLIDDIKTTCYEFGNKEGLSIHYLNAKQALSDLKQLS